MFSIFATFVGVLDTACTATCAGSEFIRKYAAKIRNVRNMNTNDPPPEVRYDKSSMSFTTGNGQVTAHSFAIIPFRYGNSWCTVGVHVLAGKLPLLFSLGTMEQMGIQLDFENGLLKLAGSWFKMRKQDGLLCIPLLENFLESPNKKYLESKKSDGVRFLSDDGVRPSSHEKIEKNPPKCSECFMHDGVRASSDEIVRPSSDDGVRHLSESLTRDSESVFPSNFSAVDNSQVAVVDGADHCDSKMASKSFATVEVPQILTNSVPENSPKGTSAQLPDAAKFASSQASTLPSSSSVSLGDDALVVLKRLNLEDSKQLVKLHRQFGHRRAERIIPILRAAGWDDASLISVKNSLDAVQAACAVCQDPALLKPGNEPKVGLPHALFPNHIMLADLTQTKDGFWWLHLLDQFSNKSGGGRCKDRRPETFIRIVAVHWVSPCGGFPKFFYADIEGGFESDKFVSFLSDGNCMPQLGPSQAKFAKGQIERHNDLVKSIYDTLRAEDPKREPDICFALALATKNELPSNDNRSPDELFSGQRANLPGAWDVSTASISRLQRNEYVDSWISHNNFLQGLITARQAAMENTLKLRIAEMAKHHVPSYKDEPALQIGEFVSFYREGTTKADTGYYGPAKVLGVDGSWVVLRNESTKGYVRVHPHAIRREPFGVLAGRHDPQGDVDLANVEVPVQTLPFERFSFERPVDDDDFDLPPLPQPDRMHLCASRLPQG